MWPDKEPGRAMGELPVPPCKRTSPWAKGHCDSLLDRIDVQLSQLQGSSPKIQGSRIDGAPPFVDGTGTTPSTADPGRWNSGGDGDLHPLKVDYGRVLPHLPESNGIPGDVKSDSVCTEDFAAEFCKGLVDLLPSSDEDEAASVLASLSSTARPPSSPHGNQPEKFGLSPPFPSFKTASDFCSLDLESKPLATDTSKGEQSEDLAPCSGELPLQSQTQPQTILESVGGQGPRCGQMCTNRTDTVGGGWPRLRSCHPKLRSSGANSVDLEMETSGETGRLESQQERRGSVGSSEWGQGASRGSILLSNTEDHCLLQSWQRATSKIRVPPVTQPRHVGGSGGCWSLTFGGEERRELRWPHSFCPPKAQLPGKMQRPTPSGFGTDPGTINALTDSQKPPGLPVGLQETWAVDAPSARVCDKAPEMSKTADSHVQKPPLTQRDLWRASSPSVSGTEEEGHVRLSAQSRWSSSEFWSWAPVKLPDPSWKGDVNAGQASLCRKDQPWCHHGEGLARVLRVHGKMSQVKGPKKDLKLEEGKLSQKMTQVQKAEASLHTTLQRKKNVAVELEILQDALREPQETAERLGLHLEEHRNTAEEARADLVLLEYKREICLKELLELEQELSSLRRQSIHYRSVQVEVSRLVSEREELKDQIRCMEDQLSLLELRLKSSRAKLTSMEEMANEKTRELQEALLSEKDLEVVRLRKMLSVLEEEKEAQDSAMRDLKDHQQQQLVRLQQEASQEKERELQLVKERALQEFAENSQEAKAAALREQATTFQKEIENLHKTVEEREAELVHQQEAMKQQATALKLEAQEMVQTALHREQKKWEGNIQAALQGQREALAEQDRKKWVDLQKALETEKKLSCALQDETADLRKKIQGLEHQACSFQGEKRARLEELQERLQMEKAEALRSLREQLGRERMQERDQMRAEVQQLEGERRRLQAECSQVALREQESLAQAELAGRCLAREVALVCRQLQDLLPRKTVALPRRLNGTTGSLTSGTALQALREVSEEIQDYLQDQSHELEMQRQHVFQIQREKDQEMRDQEEKLRLESHSDLEALKERLVQEHLKDILTLQRSWLKEERAKENPVLRPQPQERVGELQGVQKRVALRKDCQWKDKEPDMEPRRWPAMNLGSPGSETEAFPKGWSKYLPPPALCSLSLTTSRFPSQQPLPTPNFLQSRTRKLRAENSLCSGGS